MSKGEIAEKNLIDEGWEFDHSATFRGYKPAGYVSDMATRSGYEYCRVHHGKSVSNRTYQLTSVMRRPIKENINV